MLVMAVYAGYGSICWIWEYMLDTAVYAGYGWQHMLDIAVYAGYGRVHAGHDSICWIWQYKLYMAVYVGYVRKRDSYANAPNVPNARLFRTVRTGTWYRVLKHLVPGTWYQANGTGGRCSPVPCNYLVLGTRHLVPAPGTAYLVPHTWHPVPGTRYLVPGTGNWCLVPNSR